ncbi:unnamed protein product [marine sediment metagenome]|uniref:Uncharacterized protein n=1 Tax=marine sediment metagenome TaxID=412755 RepID=X0Y3H5_9ZZZZ
MSIGSFFKKLPGRVWTGAQIGLPIANQFGLGAVVPFLPLITAGMRVAQGRGIKNRMEVALADILPALRKAGVDLPVKDVKLAIEIMLNKATNGLPGEDSVWTFDTEEK